MSKPARWAVLASFFVIGLGACADVDDPGSDTSDMTMDPSTSCITLEGMTCTCPDRSYGIFACDGSCTMCPAPAAGSSGGGAAGTGAAGAGITGFAGRSGGAGRGFPGAAGTPGTGTGQGRGGAGTTGMRGGMAGAPPVPAAGMGAMMPPAAGAMAGAAGAPATTTGDVPATPACMAVSMWNAEWAAFEVEVLRLVNENRAKGWNCDTEGQKPPVGPLTMEPTLRCSARLHSKDMADQKYFAHESLDGRNPGARMTAAGYSGRTWGENIAKGQTSPAQVVAGWMDSDGHCSNIMNANFTLIGVGYFAGMGTNPRFNSELYWTQNFGAAGGGGRRP